ncbi:MULTISPECIES: pyridoxamine 5'-phosphate oxidase family protein [unclassified Paludibacterium]|uniref:pyridoxamine 5'-phosphate oxidase family protein n=1 Tax=unclassified Paludibacterium TaxID=2618429 RepID=UPI001C052378|nr:pyridoxamine 5'-phosphate oxidase family protein [Paludibacterium sp. B53371]BEV70971.1 pyridoxamine 5'-phosphate oxidase family protein [Paludibacterium sp. THUN1379]
MQRQAFRTLVEQTRLCWLASVDVQGRPMVSPKAVFAPYGEADLVIANIASAQTVNNVRHNQQASVSLLDQSGLSGLRLQGRAQLVGPEDARFADVRRPLLARTAGQWPIDSVILLQVSEVAPLVSQPEGTVGADGQTHPLWLE